MMEIESLFSDVIPTMIVSWLSLLVLIGVIHLIINGVILLRNIAKNASNPNAVSESFSLDSWLRNWFFGLKTSVLSAPNNISMAIKSAWRARERGLAIFAGVFLSSLVITTVLAYAVGLNQGFFQFSLEGEVFDAKLDFQEDPGGSWDGRTNDSMLWESFCDDLTDMAEFSDCAIVYGRQGIRINGFFDDSFAVPQPLNVVSATGTSADWGNVSWDYPEAFENGPPINDGRTIRFYGSGIWDGELADRHAESLIFGEWPSSAADAEANRSVILPSKIASSAGAEVNETISSLTFSYVNGTYTFDQAEKVFEECQGTIDSNLEVGRIFCLETFTVTNLTVTGIYEEGDFANPTLLFHPVMVTDSVLSEEQKLALMQKDHAYLGLAVDRNQLPTSSTRAATNWLSDLKGELENVNGDLTLIDPSTNESFIVKDATLPRLYSVGACAGDFSQDELLEASKGELELTCDKGDFALISVEYNDLISGTITFLNIFLGIIQVFDYILVIPVVALSFVVLIYGLVLSLEQRRREVAIHRVIGGTEATLSRMMILEVYAISSIAWVLGFVLATASVEVVLRAVGFLRFSDSDDLSVNPILSGLATVAVALLTIGVAYWRSRAATKKFLGLQIDEGVRKVIREREPFYLLHWITFFIGSLAFFESWIESNGGFFIWGSRGIIDSFIWNSLLLLLGPFFLWIGGALVLSQIGATGPQLLNRLFGWSPAISDIRRGLSGSGSSQSVSKLSLILLLTLSIVTLAAVQGHTGTLVDERTTNAQNGADLKIQFDTALTEEEARSRIMASIELIDDNDIQGISSMTSVGTTFTETKEGSTLLVTWILFDNHQDTLIWDNQAIPGDDIDKLSTKLSDNGYTAGSLARDSLDDPIIGSSITLVYTNYELNQFGIPEATGSTEATVSYAGRHQWIPGFSAAETNSVIVIGEGTYRQLVGDTTADEYRSSNWMVELCDESNSGCKDALERVAADMKSRQGIVSASDWSTAHEQNERNGGLIFGTPGLLSMMFVVAALASISSAFVFLSLVLSQRKRELAILQAIGASPNQVIRLVLFEIMSILLVSMILGVTLGLAVAQSFNGFFGVFGFIFQLFLGQSAPIDRDLAWPWFEIILVNGLVLVAVIGSLLFTTRRALDSDLATVLKGE